MLPNVYQYMLRWAHLLNSNYRLPLIICRPRKISVRFPFAYVANKQEFAISVFRLQKTNGSCRFPLVPFSICGIMEAWRHGHRDMETRRHRDIYCRGVGYMYRWRHGNIETYTCTVDMETWRNGDI
jgi:hypothetical protein